MSPLSGVSKTAILTLRARADEHARPDRVFADPLAVEWLARLAWPAELDAWYAAGAQSNLAFRADDIDHILRRAAGDRPVTVVELGCGLSTRHARVGLQRARWLFVDLPEVVALREALGARDHVASSVLDPKWMAQVSGDPIFVAEGLLYYLPRAEVDALLDQLRARFPGATLIMDVIGANDFPKLLEHTSALGCPVLWKLERDYAEVLEDFGLEAIPGLEPERLQAEALARYWPRFSPQLRVAIDWARHSPPYWRGRSGNVAGRL